MKETKKDLRFAVLAADTAIFAIRNGELLVRLIHISRPPFFPDNIGLPGGLIDKDETAEAASKRHASMKTGLSAEKMYVEQLYTFSDIGRDPRGRVIAVAYMAFIPWEKLSKDEQIDTKDSFWRPVGDAKHLAYDHDLILKTALERLRTRVTYTTLIKKLMPKEFTLTELEEAYESILGKHLDKRNFRKKILKLKVLTALSTKRSGGRFRPAQLYTFSTQKVDDIEIL